MHRVGLHSQSHKRATLLKHRCIKIRLQIIHQPEKPALIWEKYDLTELKSCLVQTILDTFGKRRKLSSLCTQYTSSLSNFKDVYVSFSLTRPRPRQR